MALSLEQYRGYYSNKKSTLKDILTKRSERERKKSLGLIVKNGDRIPEHLIVEILSRLPVKTLLRFKTVCKSWYAIIKNSHFITKHLRNYYDNDNNWRDCLIIQYAITQAGELNVYELLIDNKKNRTLAYQMIDTPIYNTYLCGPCDGIYYLWIYYEYSHSPRRSMWNPALNELIILPDITWKPNIPANSAFIRESYGFGYDSKTKDYKVIVIFSYSDTRDEDSRSTDYPMTILIYSLKTNSWRHWGDIDKFYDLERNGSYVYINGCYYWLGSRLLDYSWNYEMVIAFDIAGDAIHEIPLPPFESKPGYGSQVCIYRDSIAFVNVPDDYNTSSFSVWAWSEGVWTLSVKIDDKIRGAISHWRDNTLVFKLVRDKLLLYDTNTKEIFVLKDPQVGRCENICAYKESLVSIKGFQKRSERKIKKKKQLTQG